MQKNGDGKSSVATLDGRSGKKKNNLRKSSVIVLSPNQACHFLEDQYFLQENLQTFSFFFFDLFNIWGRHIKLLFYLADYEVTMEYTRHVLIKHLIK